MDGRVRIQRNRVDANGDSNHSRGSRAATGRKYNRNNTSESEKVLYQREYNNSNGNDRNDYVERPSSGRAKDRQTEEEDLKNAEMKRSARIIDPNLHWREPSPALGFLQESFRIMLNCIILHNLQNIINSRRFLSSPIFQQQKVLKIASWLHNLAQTLLIQQNLF